MFLKNDSCAFQSKDRSSPTVKVQCSIMFIFFRCFSAGSLLTDIGSDGTETKYGRGTRVAKHLPISWNLQEGEEHSGSVDPQ